MEFKDIKTWTVTPDHKARPKNPHYPYSPLLEIISFNDFEDLANKYTVNCLETLLPGEYSSDDVELAYQQCIAYDGELNPKDEGWQNCTKEDYLHDLQWGWDVRQYLQLKQQS